MRLAEHVALMG